MYKLTLLLLSICLAISCKTDTIVENPLQKHLESGIIEGFLSEDGTVEKYLGIPYAQPPIGNLRWKTPQKLKPWKDILKTQKYDNIAMQYKFADWVNFDEDKISEDCLYLNVWKPSVIGDRKLPVLVNIHGGGLLVGEGSEIRLEGTSMAKRGMIVVTINYRLNIFGFFAHPELSAESPYGASGNYGYMDQQFALQWVKNNIEVFGGDPNRITIAGESAGAYSVLSLMVSPLSKDLIAGAIGSSGGLIPLLTMEEAERRGTLALNKSGYKSITELRKASSEDILNIYKNSNSSAYTPTLDNYFFTKDIPEIYKAQEQANIPLLIGWNTVELTPESYLGGPNYTKDNFVNITKAYYPNHFEKILEMFPNETEDEIKWSAIDLASIRFIGQGAWKWFDLHRQHNSKPVFRYLYSKVHPPHKSVDLKIYKPPLGAHHAQEIPYSWGNLPLITDFNYSEDDYKVSDIMQVYFSNFIKTGNPNGNQLPNWPACEPDNGFPIIMNIDTETKLVRANLDYRFRFFDEEGFPYGY